MRFVAAKRRGKTPGRLCTTRSWAIHFAQLVSVWKFTTTILGGSWSPGGIVKQRHAPNACKLSRLGSVPSLKPYVTALRCVTSDI